jgi:lipoyl(octanoyl) transferase
VDAVARDCAVRELGRRPFAEVWPAMEAWTDARDADSVDELWLVEHEPVFTLGQAGRDEHVLVPGEIPVIRTNRGGQVTYHGPGQIVAYPLLDLRRIGIGVRQYVERLEQAMIDTLAHWNLRGERHDGAPGVYVDGAKIGALGIRVRRGCSFHGIAFNVDLDLEPFGRINPCGYRGLRCTSMLDLGVDAGMPGVRERLLRELCRQFGLRPLAGEPAARPVSALA